MSEHSVAHGGDDGSASAPARELADLPGPPRWPVVGNLLQVRMAGLHHALESWSRQYGPLWRFAIGRHLSLVIADHQLFAAVLRERPDTFCRPLASGRIVAELGFAPGLFSANGELWQRQRRMVMAAFDPGHVQAYLSTLHRVNGRLHRRWQAAARREQAIVLQTDLTRFTVDAIAGLAFGSDVNTLESDGDVIQRHLDRIFPALQRRALAVFPYWRYIRLPRDRAIDNATSEVRQAIAGFIGDARARMTAEPARREQPANLLEALIVAAEEPGSGLADADVAGNVLTMLLAGEDTTAHTLSWMIDLLWRHPEALARVRDEVRDKVRAPLAPTLAELASCAWLEACAHETMRLKPVAPLQTAQVVKPTTVGGVRLRPGVVIWGVMRHDTLDDRHFTDARRFLPERWLDGGPIAQHAASPRRVSMPFGAGPRVCPGRHLAMVEMKMVITMLVGCFDVLDVSAPGGGETEERLSFTMAPVGLRMRVR